ncbi:class I SAM-dependent methyltransferase [Streptomyces tubercidicus]|uniref:Methyltransferase n=1 Tax=Streptomyces tubercidicus TaxID=47759 RepID=A0A640V3K2_9ACTN|nr:class I SAM-dependent methyltransferase [Streptomyces tubercidicus]WAU15608.1 methyltransferase domain-containing protein [Streptomyces tubercidicus]GFE41485.1 methyltransferase [Streptomyces tubercidicus]
MTQRPATTTPYNSGMLSNDADRERDRLAAIQRNVDTFTTGLLDGLGIEPSWNCLELGAGAGSIAYWLAERCPDGRVVGVDLDTRHLDASRAANLEIQEADITREDYPPGSFDLIHARYLFCHLPERDEMIARATRWLSPGGWLIVEEPYQLPGHTSPFPVVQRLLDAYQHRYQQHGADLTWVRGLPALLARNALTEVAFAANPGCMGGLDKDRWLPLITQAAPGLLADGLITEADLAEFAALLKDPAFIDIPQVTISAWGRRPAESTATA